MEAAGLNKIQADEVRFPKEQNCYDEGSWEQDRGSDLALRTVSQLSADRSIFTMQRDSSCEMSNAYETNSTIRV